MSVINFYIKEEERSQINHFLAKDTGERKAN